MVRIKQNALVMPRERRGGTYGASGRQRVHASNDCKAYFAWLVGDVAHRRTWRLAVYGGIFWYLKRNIFRRHRLWRRRRRHQRHNKHHAACRHTLVAWHIKVVNRVKNRRITAPARSAWPLRHTSSLLRGGNQRVAHANIAASR